MSLEQGLRTRAAAFGAPREDLATAIQCALSVRSCITVQLTYKYEEAQASFHATLTPQRRSSLSKHAQLSSTGSTTNDTLQAVLCARSFYLGSFLSLPIV